MLGKKCKKGFSSFFFSAQFLRKNRREEGTRGNTFQKKNFCALKMFRFGGKRRAEKNRKLFSEVSINSWRVRESSSFCIVIIIGGVGGREEWVASSIRRPTTGISLFFAPRKKKHYFSLSESFFLSRFFLKNFCIGPKNQSFFCGHRGRRRFFLLSSDFFHHFRFPALFRSRKKRKERKPLTS